MTFYIPTAGIDDWRMRLADPIKHWKIGRSARALASCWEAHHGFPNEVQQAMAETEYWAAGGLDFVMGFPEHKTPLPGGRRASQSDILVLARSSHGAVCMAVEGKVDEGFGPPVADWLTDSPSPGKLQRLSFLADLLQVATADLNSIPYQLVHRTGAAIIEAERFDADAAMLVHSWGDSDGYEDFARFAELLGAAAAAGRFSRCQVGDRPLHLGWVQGAPEWLEA